MLIGGPLGEEPGWRGFALPRLRQKFCPLAGRLVLGILSACWHMPVWFGGRWTVTSLPNIATYVAWMPAGTIVLTWVSNHTNGSVLIAVLAHPSMDTFLNVVRWPSFRSTGQMTNLSILYGCLGLFIGFGSAALALIYITRGRLEYQVKYAP